MESNQRGWFCRPPPEPLGHPTLGPHPEIMVSSCIGFLFLKNLLGIPVKNIQHYWERMCLSLYPTMSHSRRRHSAESFLKSWFEDSEYLLLIVVSPGLEPVCHSWFSLQLPLQRYHLRFTTTDESPLSSLHQYQPCGLMLASIQFRHLTISPPRDYRWVVISVFYFLKTCEASLIKNIQQLLGGGVSLSLFPTTWRSRCPD